MSFGTHEMFDPLPPAARASGTPPEKPYAIAEWQPIVPVPDHAPREFPRHRLGKPSATWTYRDARGRVLHHVCRWDPQGERKTFLPLTFCRTATGNRAWCWQHLPTPRPMYGLDRLAAHPDATVLLVEGEKTADAAAKLFPDHVVVTSGGSNSAAPADWLPLAGRDVVIWPDNDPPGRNYAGEAPALIAKAGAKSVRVVDVPTTWPVKWDLADAPPEDVTVETLREMLAEAVPQTIGVPDMSIVNRARQSAPQLDLEPFGLLRPWIEQAAESKGAPRAYVAMALLGSAAGTVGASRWVSPWAEWSEPASVWIMLVGNPSASKSPAMDAARAPLAEIEAELAVVWPDTLRAHDAARVAAETHCEVWEASAREAAKAGDAVPSKPPEADLPPEPQMPRIVIVDATIEAVAAIEAGNPRGLLLWRDECAAWLANLGKYGDGDRAFWLEAYGARPYTVDRKKLAQPLRIEHHAVSIVAGIQPDRLASLVLAGDDDGLAARFLYCWPEPVPPTRPRVKPDAAIVVRALRRLRGLEFQSDGERRLPVTLAVEPAALDVWQAWREEHHRATKDLSGLAAGAWGKMPGQALRIALVLELLAWAAGPDGSPEPLHVSGDRLGHALDLIENYFKPMLSRVLGEAALPQDERNAATLGRAILSRKAKQINAREVRRNWRLPGLRDAKDVMAAIGVLEDAGWLSQLGGREGNAPGRQRADFTIDPRVHGGQP